MSPFKTFASLGRKKRQARELYHITVSDRKEFVFGVTKKCRRRIPETAGIEMSTPALGDGYNVSYPPG